MAAGLIESAHDCSDGGLAVTLAESCFAKRIGARISLKSEGVPAEFQLFGEDASRILVSCPTENLQQVREVAVKWGVSADPIGETVTENLSIAVDGRTVVSAPVEDLFGIWTRALAQIMHPDTQEQMAPAHDETGN